jgi:hypothetical protein
VRAVGGRGGANRWRFDEDLRSSPAPAEIPDMDAPEAIAAALRAPTARFVAEGNPDPAALIAAACDHRVLVLLGSALAAAGTLDSWPPAFRERCRSAERSAAILEGARHEELARALQALTAAGVRTLLIKGAALAYTAYSAPHLRVRTDTDLLVDPGDIARTRAVFADLGYQADVETSGSLVSHQMHFAGRDRFGIAHAFDVHWKISDRQALADALWFAELWNERIDVPAIGPGAITVRPSHALLIALLHRAGHHPGADDLLWIYDIHLLAGQLAPGERQHFARVTLERGHGALAREGLTLAHRRYGSPDVKALAEAMQQPAADSIAGQWRRPSSLADMLQLDLRALPTWRARTSLLREHLLPRPDYMRQKYNVRSNAMLPPLYLWRILTGAPAWFRRF